MKTTTVCILAFAAGLLIWQATKPARTRTGTVVAKPTAAYDYPSNPAPGYTIVCNAKGQFSTADGDGFVMHGEGAFVYNDRQKAIEHSWNWYRRLESRRTNRAPSENPLERYEAYSKAFTNCETK